MGFKPGYRHPDHPLTWLFYKDELEEDEGMEITLPIFSDSVDQLLREVAHLVGEHHLDELGIDWLKEYGTCQQVPSHLADLEERLSRMRDQLEQEASERGWEV